MPAEAPAPGGRVFLALWPDARLREAMAQASPAQRERLVALTLGLEPPGCQLVLDRFGYFRSAAVFWLGPTRVPPSLPGRYRIMAGSTR